MWSRLSPSTETKDLYTSVLGIPNATPLDEGVYTCQVNEQQQQQYVITI